MLRNEKKQFMHVQEVRKKRIWRQTCSAMALLLFFLMFSGESVKASSFGSDYRYWSQGGSDYSGMREVGCLITAQAKMLYEANVNRDASFNPDAWYNCLLANGWIASSSDLNMRDHNAPVYYANSRGKNLEYLGYWNADDSQLWFNINAGYYTIVNVGGTNTGGTHFVLLDNALSKQTGTLYCYDSFSDRGTVSQQLLTRYSIHRGGHVYRGNNAVHTHSYSWQITKQPTCTQTGVRTYTCSCGASYTESVAAKGHNYGTKIIAPTWTEQGYTLHTCSVCGNSYRDNYVEPPKQNADGWYYTATVPDGISASDYEIQYQNIYEKVQQSSPGTGWTNAGTVKDEWQNSGSTYTSESDLQTSDARVLVRSVFYHFCGPNAGNEGNYEQSGNFVHYDEILSTSVTSRYLGTDNGHPYYYIDWIDGGGRVWCKSGVSCDGAYGNHGNRCCAWYKLNTYQDRVRVLQYKFTKTSDWIDTRDLSATSVRIRFRALEPTEPDTKEPGITEPIEPDTKEPGTTEPTEPDTKEPGTTEPTEPDTKEPGTTEPTEPGIKEPGTTEPGTETPDTNKPDPSQGNTEFTYERNSDGFSITITKCISSDTNIVIPDSIDGYTVTEIGANAFENVTSMCSVSFPPALTKIDDYAFAGCTSLSSVTLPDTLTSLGYYAFKDCSSLTSAVLNQGRKTITIGLFYGCFSLNSVTVPDTVSCISEDAFRGCTALKNLNLPKSLSLVSKNAFLNSGITTVHYAGTSADWKKITIYTSGNSAFLNAVVTGSNGKTFSANSGRSNTGSSSASRVQIPSVSKVYSLKAKAGKKKLKLSWNKVYGAAGYQIQVDTTKYFFTPKTISVSGARKAYTKGGLKAKKKYYVRIRAYKTYRDARGYTQKAYGSWSKVSKKTK